ncbi:hypothetical protein HD554DRAFT_2067794 [Boletus coccyginus]|nr:hypothetical protein HD554DRAFT_2067794 [Boletus coccyginus]
MTTPSIFNEGPGVYQQSVGIAGSHYIALGIGITGASQVNGRTMDKVHLKNKNGGVGKPDSSPPSRPIKVLLKK